MTTHYERLQAARERAERFKPFLPDDDKLDREFLLSVIDGLVEKLVIPESGDRWSVDTAGKVWYHSCRSSAERAVVDSLEVGE